MRTWILLPIIAAACSNSSVSPANTAANVQTAAPLGKLRIVPQGMIGVALVGVDRAPYETVTADELLAKQKEVAAAVEAMGGAATEGAAGLFFYGFDSDRLVYHYGHTHWRCKGLGCWDYVAAMMYVVRRQGDAAVKLGVDRKIDLYEHDHGGIRGGMSMDEVKALLGPPPRTSMEQRVGDSRWYYADRTILFLGGSVAAVEPPP